MQRDRTYFLGKTCILINKIHVLYLINFGSAVIMQFSKDEVETIFWLLMGSGQSESKDAILKRIFELYDPCPICGGFFDKSDQHHHDDF